MPTFGVVITSYNCARFLERSTDGVFSQRIPFQEVVVVDDASTDETPFLLERLKKRYPTLKVLRNEKNLERCASRNKGAEILNTDYVCFCDCDDLYTPDYLENVLKVVTREKPAAVYQFPRGFVDEKGGVIKEKKPPLETFEELLFSGNVGYPTGSCFKRDIFLELGGYREKYLMREDWEIFIRFYVKGFKISFIPRGEYYIGEHPSRTSSKNPKFLEATLKVVNDYFDKTPDEFKGLLLYHAAVQCFRFKRRGCGFEYLTQLVKKSPSVLLNGKRFWELFKRTLKV